METESKRIKGQEDTYDELAYEDRILLQVGFDGETRVESRRLDERGPNSLTRRRNTL